MSVAPMPVSTAIHPLVPPKQPKGIELENLGRRQLRQMLDLRVDITAPTWNQILFSTHKKPVKIEKLPEASMKALDKPLSDVDPGAPPDAVRDEARQLFTGLSTARPVGNAPRSIAGGLPMPPPADKYAKWLRRVYLVTVGPEAVRLLVASGYLLSDDVSVLEVVYPEGLDVERKDATQSAINLTNAALRNGADASLPAWLNAQLLTLMDETQPSKYFKQIYTDEQKQPQSNGPAPSSQPNLISQQSEPSPSTQNR